MRRFFICKYPFHHYCIRNALPYNAPVDVDLLHSDTRQ